MGLHNGEYSGRTAQHRPTDGIMRALDQTERVRGHDARMAKVCARNAVDVHLVVYGIQG